PTSPAPGQLPSTSVSELNCGCFGSTENPRWGAKPKLITLPFLPIRFVLSSATPPVAAATADSCFTFGSSDSSNGGRFVFELVLTAERPVMAASVPRYALAKIVSNALEIESVSTYVP